MQAGVLAFDEVEAGVLVLVAEQARVLVLDEVEAGY